MEHVAWSWLCVCSSDREPPQPHLANLVAIRILLDVGVEKLALVAGRNVTEHRLRVRVAVREARVERLQPCKEGQCLSHEGSGNTRQRQCFSHDRAVRGANTNRRSPCCKALCGLRAWAGCGRTSAKLFLATAPRGGGMTSSNSPTWQALKLRFRNPTWTSARRHTVQRKWPYLTDEIVHDLLLFALLIVVIQMPDIDFPLD